MPLPAFHDVQFPLSIAFGTVGGPERTNEIVPLSNGSEQRNARRRHARRRYDAGSGIRSIADLREVIAFFEARRGSLIAFRFPDPLDDRSSAGRAPPVATDQRLGTGDGRRRMFQLVKRYGDGEDAYERPITRPREGSTSVAVDGSEVGATVDATTGTVTLAQTPAAGSIVTAGFLFDVPVRFDLDHLAVSLTGFEAGEVPSIALVEVRA